MNVNVDEIARLIDLLDKSSLAELSWSSDNERLSLKKPGVGAPVQMFAAPAPVAASPVKAPRGRARAATPTAIQGDR